MGSDPLADDLARAESGDPLADDLAKKGVRVRTQAEWEASPEYAKLKTKHDATVAKTEALRNEEPSVIDRAADIGKDFATGVGAAFEDEANAATLGLYGRAMDAVQPTGVRQESKQLQAQARQTPGWNVISGVGQAGAAGIGAPGRIYQGISTLMKAGSPVITGMLAGAATGGAQAGIESAGRDDAKTTLKRVGVGAGIGAGVGAGAGLIGKYVGGAPERKAESELGGLKEGVQYKTRVQKFVPNEENFRVALAEKPDARALAKTDPVAAKPVFDQIVDEKSNQLLNPIYERMAEVGRDGIPIQTIKNQLLTARGGFNKFSEGAAIKNVDALIAQLEEHAAQNGGVIPAQLVRETATSFGKQGFENLPNFGTGPVGKQLKQDVSMALREAIGDHVESLAGSGPGGKALRDAYEAANREVSTWIRMREIIDEKAQRISGNAAPMGDLVAQGVNAIKHPFMTVGKMLVGKAPDFIDRNVLGPAVQSKAGQALAPVGTTLQRGAPSLVDYNSIMDLLSKRRRPQQGETP